MWPTPDPSAATSAIYVAGFVGDAADWVRLAIFAMVAGCAVAAFGIAVLGGLLMRTR